jgi:hypothetical protein
VTGSCESAATPLTFTFQSPIPINAASLTLQVVYRGSLGSESDAVVVQTVDVSEPTYYFYMNASDYIKIGASVYTRDRINNDPPVPDNFPAASALRALVRPLGCIVNDQLSDTCFQPFDVSFPLQWGNPPPATPTLAAPLALTTVRTYSRFAMLVPPGLAAVVDQSASVCFPRDPNTFSGRELQERFVPVPAQPGVYQQLFVLSTMWTVRGVNASYGVACVSLGDGQAGVSADDRIAKMTPFTGAELTAKPLVGFTFGN